MLTIKSVEALKPKAKLYRVADDGVKGFCLEVAPNGSKRWRFRFRFEGKAGMISLGLYPEVSLSRERELALDARRELANGKKPGGQEEETQKPSDAFVDLFDEWVEQQKNKGLVWQTYAAYERYRRYLYSSIGTMPAEDITSVHLCALCKKIAEEHTPKIAHAVLTCIGQVMRYGIPSGVVKVDPTIGVRGAIPATAPTKSRAAITNPDDVPELLHFIDEYSSFTMRGYLQLMALFFVRAKELALAEWTDIDWERKLFRIPAERMKKRNDHLVPLATQAIAILEALRVVNGNSRYIFPGRGKGDRPMNPQSPLLAIGPAFKGRMVVHGFRSMASTLLNERGWNPDVIEAQLAHQDANTVRRAYNRAQYLEDRRKMMQEWADYLDELRAKN